MSLRHVDLDAALRRLAEQRIEQAMRQGKFDHLAGAGRPLQLEPIPPGENARLAWWALRILRQNGVIPDEIRWRKTLDMLRERLDSLTDRRCLEATVTQINHLIRKLNTLGTNAIPTGFAILDLEKERERLEQRLLSEADRTTPQHVPGS